MAEESGQPVRGLQEVQGVSRRGGVDDDEVEAVLLGELVELLHRHVLLGPREGLGQVAVDPVPHDPVGLLGVSAYLRTRSSKVLFGSSCRAQSSPLHGPGTRFAVFPRLSSPSESASRRAGSIVTTHDRLPVRAPSRARAAEIVVFPTPPEPQLTTMRLSAIRASTAAARECSLMSSVPGHLYRYGETPI